MQGRRLNTAALLSIAALALLLFGIGLISPLTPSEGTPSIHDVALFVGVPLLLSLAGLYLCGKSIARIVLLCVLLIIVVAGLTVLVPVYSSALTAA